WRTKSFGRPHVQRSQASGARATNSITRGRRENTRKSASAGPQSFSSDLRALLTSSSVSLSSPSRRLRIPDHESRQTMVERLLLRSTCGTSLLTNGASADDRAWLTKVANDIEVDAARLTPIVSARRDALKAADEFTRRKMSAELNGIGAVRDRYQPKQLFHVLVHTDTALGRASADLVQEALGNQNLLVS